MNEPLTQLEAATMLTQEIADLGPHAHEKEIFDAVYHFLEYLDEQVFATEADLDEEEELELTPIPQGTFDGFGDEYELTPAGDFAAALAQFDKEMADETQPGEFSADMSDEFSEFSPSVGTFEGTSAIHDIVPDAWLKFESRIDREVVADPTINRPVMRAPVAERVHVPFNAAKTIGEVFQPCLGGAEYAGDL